MNRSEHRRVTVPPLPNPGEKDLKKIIHILNGIILELYQRDSDKEQRVRILEDKKERGRTTRVGIHWKMVESTVLIPGRGYPLNYYYSEDGITWPPLSDPTFQISIEE